MIFHPSFFFSSFDRSSEVEAKFPLSMRKIFFSAHNSPILNFPGIVSRIWLERVAKLRKFNTAISKKEKTANHRPRDPQRPFIFHPRPSISRFIFQHRRVLISIRRACVHPRFVEQERRGEKRRGRNFDPVGEGET